MSKKKISVLGDSISTFRGSIPEENRWFYNAEDTNHTGITKVEETWWHNVIEALDGEFLANASFSGSMVQGSKFPAGNSKERAHQVLGAKGEAPDVILVFIGINDYGWGSPEAQAKGKSFASPANYDNDLHPLVQPFDLDAQYEGAPGASQIDPKIYEHADLFGIAPEGALQSFRTSYEEMLRNLKEVAPQAEIICVTLSPAYIPGEEHVFCYQLRGIELDEYNKAIQDAAQSVGAHVADIRGFGVDYNSLDGTHPTQAGMRQIADMVVASLSHKELPPSMPEAQKSIRFPQEDYVAGKPKAPVSDTGWKCIGER